MVKERKCFAPITLPFNGDYLDALVPKDLIDVVLPINYHIKL
jgi:hypothetical protein